MRSNYVRIRRRSAVFFIVLSTSSIGAQTPAPPIARIIPRADTTLGDIRIDNYFWIRDDARKNPDVIAYFDAENQYSEAVMKPLEPLVEKLYQEMKGRIKETDLSVPERVGNYYYYSRTEAGKQYPILARKKGNLAAPEEVMLDENVAAGSSKYFRVGVTKVSPNDRFLAFTLDTTGGERYTLVVKDLTTGEMLAGSRAEGELLPRMGRRQRNAILWKGRRRKPLVPNSPSRTRQRSNR